jgi:hypothetical protein
VIYAAQGRRRGVTESQAGTTPSASVRSASSNRQVEVRHRPAA